MPGTLYVVATPIGNLEDITLRALRVLREVALIAAEDTRRTARLLQHYSISTPTTSLHEHNERAKGAAVVERLRGGDSVALVTDAGTPGISDPGARVVALARAAGVRVEPVPGPSAALAALSASGFETDQFVFAGFPPARSKARLEWLTRLREEPRVLIVYEAPHRIVATLQAMLDVLGDRQVCLARELTKSFEESVVRPISGHISHISEGRGEYTLVVDVARVDAVAARPVPEAATIARQFGELTNNEGVPRRAAIKQLAQRYSVPAREVYRLIESGKVSVD
jgi:16S rRNA (cytidine1402-2'-O)-methyltransferase